MFDDERQTTEPCRPDVSDNALKWLPRGLRTSNPLQKTIIVGQKPQESVSVIEACLLLGFFPDLGVDNASIEVLVT
jgi:hypothetical protein